MKKILAILAMAASTVHAASWEVVNAANGKVDYMRRADLTESHGYVRGWVKSNFTEPRLMKRTGEAYGSSLTLMLFNCAEHEIADLSYVYYSSKDTGGDVVYMSSSAPAERFEFEPVIPDSVGEALFEYACKPPKAKRAKH